jgi:adenylate cyclase
MCLCWTVLVLSHWDKFNYQFSALLFLAILLVYQSATLLPIFYRRVLLWQRTLGYAVAFLDALLTGLLITFIDHNYAISISLLIGFLVVYMNPINSMSAIAILGIVLVLLFDFFCPCPSVQITPLMEAIVLTLILGFYALYILIKHNHDQAIVDQLEHEVSVNRELTLRNFKLSKYLSPVLSKSISAGTQVQVWAEEKPLTIFFSDMQGFSKLSEQLSPEMLTWLMNSYLTEMCEIAFRFNGTLDKVMGDSLMIFFGDPQSRGEQNDAISCVCMAISMIEAMENLKKRWIAKGIEEPPNLRIGINSGICKVGNYGSEDRLEYTVLGSAVNLASRLESLAGLNEIILSETTYNLVKKRVRCIEKDSAHLKGFTEKVRIFKAVNIYKNQR